MARALHSVFISYGGSDERFAERLQEDLRRRRVKAFVFSKDAEPGAKLHKVMREGVNKYDRVILICSRDSLSRPGVLNEIEETLQREAREGGSAILIPLTLDDYLFEELTQSNRTLADILRARVVADFRKARVDASTYALALKRLLKALHWGTSERNKRSKVVENRLRIRSAAVEGKIATIPNLPCFVMGFGFGRAVSFILAPSPHNAEILVGFAESVGIPLSSLQELRTALKRHESVPDDLVPRLQTVQKTALLVRQQLAEEGRHWFDFGKVLHDVRYAKYFPFLFSGTIQQLDRLESLMERLDIREESDLGKKIREFISAVRDQAPDDVVNCYLDTLPPAIAATLGF